MQTSIDVIFSLLMSAVFTRHCISCMFSLVRFTRLIVCWSDKWAVFMIPMLVLTLVGCHVTVTTTRRCVHCVRLSLLTLEPKIGLTHLRSHRWHLTGLDYCFYFHDLVFAFQSALSSLQGIEQTQTQTHAHTQYLSFFRPQNINTVVLYLNWQDVLSRSQ